MLSKIFPTSPTQFVKIWALPYAASAIYLSNPQGCCNFLKGVLKLAGVQKWLGLGIAAARLTIACKWRTPQEAPREIAEIVPPVLHALIHAGGVFGSAYTITNALEDEVIGATATAALFAIATSYYFARALQMAPRKDEGWDEGVPTLKSTALAVAVNAIISFSTIPLLRSSGAQAALFACASLIGTIFDMHQKNIFRFR